MTFPKVYLLCALAFFSAIIACVAVTPATPRPDRPREIYFIAWERYTFHRDSPEAGIKKGDRGLRLFVPINENTLGMPMPDVVSLTVGLDGAEDDSARIVEAICDSDGKHNAFVVGEPGIQVKVLMIHPRPHASYILQVITHYRGRYNHPERRGGTFFCRVNGIGGAK